jgi:hypothetical protein
MRKSASGQKKAPALARRGGFRPQSVGHWGVGVTDADSVNERNDQPFHAVRKRNGEVALLDKGEARNGLTGAFTSSGD